MPLNITQRVDLLKSLGRPTIHDYIPLLFKDFFELHGDRYYSDDPAILGGIGFFDDKPITIISQVRAKDIETLKRINFSMPHPEGYRKALRWQNRPRSSKGRCFALSTLPARTAESALRSAARAKP